MLLLGIDIGKVQYAVRNAEAFAKANIYDDIEVHSTKMTGKINHKNKDKRMWWFPSTCYHVLAAVMPANKSRLSYSEFHR